MAKILIADDEVIITMQIEHFVTSIGHSVAGVAHSAEEAVEKARALLPDLVFMDIVMPGDKDGIEAATSIHEELGVPVIFLTAYEACAFIEGVVRTGSYAYLVKPFKEYEVKAAIEIALYKSSMEKRLRESESRYRMLVETATEGIWQMDGDSVTTFVNSAMAELLGYVPDEMVGKHVTFFMFEDDLPGHRARISQRSRGRPGKYEQKFRHSDGHAVWCIVSAQALANPDGTFGGSFAMFTDISEQKEADELIRLQALVLDQIQDTVTITDLGGNIVYVNEAMPRRLKYDRNDLIGKSVEFLDEDPARGDTQRGVIARTLADGEWKGRVVNRASDGNHCIIDLRTQLIRNAMGRPIAMCGIGSDITEQKRMENTIKQERDNLMSILAASPVGMMVFGESEEVVFANPAVERLFKVKTRRLKRKRCGDLVSCSNRKEDPGGCGHSTDCALCPLYSAIKSTLKKGRGIRDRESMVLTDAAGRRREMWVRYSVAPLALDGQRCAVMAVDDVTRRKRAEEQLRAALGEKEVLLREIHHRVKNNLQVIASMCNLQAGYIQDRKALEAFADSQMRIRSMSMVHDRLFQSDNLAEINIADYVSDLVQSLFASYGMERGRIHFSLAIPELVMDIDSVLPCGLIINELVSNALKHAFPDEHGGTVRVAMKEGDGAYEISVSDDGVGLPQGFDFRKADSMGLQLVNILVEQLEGSIVINRVEGTEFVISFSAAKQL